MFSQELLLTKLSRQTIYMILKVKGFPLFEWASSPITEPLVTQGVHAYLHP